MDMKEILEKCKLTKEEMDIYLQKTKSISKKEHHYRAYRTMMNKTRRELLEFIDGETRSKEEISNKFPIEEGQLSYHLSMLEQLNLIFKSDEGWKATPGGLGFLANTIMG